MVKSDNILYLLTSSADCAIKNPCVLALIFAFFGLIEILLSAPSSPLISIAKRSSFNFVKHNLRKDYRYVDLLISILLIKYALNTFGVVVT